MSDAIPVVLWWIKRDLRVRDNDALRAAVDDARRRRASLLPLYVWDDALVTAPDTSIHHLRAIDAALQHLNIELTFRGAPLLTLAGRLPDRFSALSALLGEEITLLSIWAHEETSLQAGYHRDEAVRSWAATAGVPFREVPRNGVVRRLSSRDRRIAIVERRLRATPQPAPESIPMAETLRRRVIRSAWIPGSRFSAPDPGANIPRPTPPEDLLFAEHSGAHWRGTGGRALQRVDETAAETVLQSFLSHRGHAYSGGMSSPVTAPGAASRLSVHLAWGTISLRQVMGALSQRLVELKESDRRAVTGHDSSGHPITVGRWRKSLLAVESRLYWHDHFIQRLEDEPETEFYPINRAFTALSESGFFPTPEAEYRRRLDAWLSGSTGYPMVDASIRGLRLSGYLPFRMRAMIVSFAIHVLRLDWRDILYPMAQWMADYVPGIHLSQLQMQAALTGINTIRVYNPTKQLTDHDRDALYVRAMVP
ncbi:MAG: FAD-binding domain-containing protein, partial [Alkalispirochaeta sp.]